MILVSPRVVRTDKNAYIEAIRVIWYRNLQYESEFGAKLGSSWGPPRQQIWCDWFRCDRKPLKSRNQALRTRKVAKTNRFEAVWRRWDAAESKEGKEQKPAFGPIGVVKIDFGLNLSHGSKFLFFLF